MSQYKIQLETFEGPLDLLLRLIEEEKLPITEISLAKVTDQFLIYVKEAEALALGEVADFLAVAAKLLLIKSRVLLPNLNLAIDEEASSLERQLKIYKEYFEASKKIKELLKKQQFMFSRTKPVRVLTNKFLPPSELKFSDLSAIFAKVLLKLELVVNLPKEVIKRTISIREKIKHITDLILEKVAFSFRQLIGRGNDKTEVIVSFLAVLELVKQRTLDVEQGELFAEINIKKLEH